MMNMPSRSTQEWAPLTESSLTARALSVAREVAERCKSREQLLAANDAALRQTVFPRTIYWEPHGVAQGDAGIALMCSYFDACFPAEGWDKRGHEFLIQATRGAETTGAHYAGLYSGLAGLAFSAWSLSRNGSRYKKLLTSLDYSISGRALEPSAALAGRHGVAVSEFDLIVGLSGVAAYLLQRGYEPPMDVALQAILDSLVALTEETGGVPHWYTPYHLLAGEGMAEHYPQGNLNCGLAHGIPGPLAVMALGLEAGLPVDGLREAVTRTAQWLVHHRSGDSYGVNWPTVVPYSDDGNVEPAQLDSSRAGWCYGTPGVARSLWLAGRALGDESLQQIAVEGMEAVYKRPIEERRIDSPTFCHGVAGLLQVTLRFAHDTGLPVFTEAASELTEQLLSMYDPERALGFCSIEPGGNLVDQPGLLDGAPGVALVLLAASSKAEPTWDRLFLLS
jgi:lantibiotic biosynthesis protein